MPFVETGSYPTREGNRVVPWIDGEPAFRRICEAIEAARESVWTTVTFMWPSFQMPDGRGSALDVLEHAANRGVDVRVIFWRPDDETAELRQNAFWGSAAHFDLLSRRYPGVNIRWDRAHPGFCQHQKTWLIDARRDSATAFVGGINLNPHALVTPDHRGENHHHDLYVEVAGPAVADVHHNFVQRWNEASERRRTDGRWGNASGDGLDFSTSACPEQGEVLVQIQRTTHEGRYTDGQAPPGGSPFPIARGETTIFDQYCMAICAARRTIYIENQYLQVSQIVHSLEFALTRGVRVVAMLPAVPQISARAKIDPAYVAAVKARARLARFDNFAICGIAGQSHDGGRRPVYVHSKLMLVDDEWATVGSCNLHRHSLFGNGEMNAAFEDAVAVRALRVALFREHLGLDTSARGDTDAFLFFRDVAADNRARHDRGDSDWQGMAFLLGVDVYGVDAQFSG